MQNDLDMKNNKVYFYGRIILVRRMYWYNHLGVR